MLEHEVQFESAAHFVREYEAHLSHDGLILPVSPAPPVFTPIKLTLVLPPDQVKIVVDATVVAPLPHGIGVQLSPLKGEAKELFDKHLEQCRLLSEDSKDEVAAPISSASLASISSMSGMSASTPSLHSVEVVRSASREELSAPRSPAATSSAEHMAVSAERRVTMPHEDKPQKVSTSGVMSASDVPTSPPIPPLAQSGATLRAVPAPERPTSPISFTTPPRHIETLPYPTLSEHVAADTGHEIAPSLRVGALDALLLPAEDDEQPQSGGTGIHDDLAYPFIAESKRPVEHPLPPHLRSTPKTSPPASVVPSVVVEDVAPVGDVSLDFFPPEEIHREASSNPSLSQMDSVEPPMPSTHEHLSVSSSAWPAATYSYDSLPSAHFTPPPDTLTVPKTPAQAAPSMSGTFDETPSLPLLLSLSTQDTTGMLHVLGMEATFNIFFHKGHVVCMTEDPAPEHHLLGSILIELGHITDEDRRDVMDRANPEARLFGQLLQEAGLVSSREIAQGLRHQLQRRIGCVAKLTEGHFTFYEKRLPSKRTPLAPPTQPERLLFRSLLETYGKRLGNEARQIEMPFLSQFVVRIDRPRVALAALRLSANEMSFWDELMTGKLMLRDIYKASTFPRRRTHATIFALHELGLVRFQLEIDEDRRLQELSDFYQSRYRLIGKESYFTFLGLRWNASQVDIAEACRKIREDYDIEMHEGEWPESLHTMSQAILEHVKAAEESLSQGQRRDLASPSQLTLSIDELIEQADLALYRRDYDEAVDRLEKILDIDPNHRDAIAKLRVARRRGTQVKGKLGTRDFKEGIGLEVDWEELSKSPSEEERDGVSKDDSED